ncbi:MAG: response regulator [Bacteroidetes bacterium]|nr:response regulator [Bacteroidota bacterium]
MNKMLNFLGSVFKGKESETLKNLEKLKILLVEDNAINQVIAEKMLLKDKCKPDIANNGKEALKMLKENHYDVILMDIKMPIMDGYEATKIIREKFPKPANQTPIIALTAYLSLEEKEKYLDAGMNDCISKPLDITVLKNSIGDILSCNQKKESVSIKNERSIGFSLPVLTAIFK